MNESHEGHQARRRRFGGVTGGLLLGAVIGLIFGWIQGDLLQGLGFGVIVGFTIGIGLEGRGQLMQYKPGTVRRIILAAGLFLISLLVTFEFIDDLENGTGAILLVLLPAATFLLFVIALGSAIAGLDELQRRIQTEAIAIGFGFTAVVVLAVGLLGLTGIEQPNWSYAGLPLVVGWGLGKIWTLWKYR
ncbi:MAG: hypothetical protein ACK2T2_13605 [Anaerolineales bacterium]|jgi:hypothetical protein